MARDYAGNFSASTDSGIPLAAVRKDTGAVLVSVDGQWTPLQVDSSGNLRVSVNAGTVTLTTGDVQIGAVEIKNSTDDTRATVGANGLYVDVRNITKDGQQVMASSIPVAIASNQTAIPITDNSGSLTVDAPVATPVFVRLSDGSAAITTLPVSLASVPSHAVTNAGVFVIQENGAALTALQLIDDAVVAQAAALGSTKVSLVGGSVTTAAPTFTTGNVNQLSLTTSGALRVDLGATSANATAIKVDGSTVTQPISIAATVTTKETRSSTGTTTSVLDSAVSATLLASNANRLGASIYNDSTVALYLKLGATASTTSFTVKLDADDYYEAPAHYTGIIDGIWASDAAGAARITELT